MVSLQEQLQQFNDTLDRWLGLAKEYFLQLNDYEKYAWAGEGVGFLLVLVGVALLFV
jgi:hypothetical protein